MCEGGAGGREVGRVLGLVEWRFWVRAVLFGDDVVDGLFHCLVLIFYWPRMQIIRVCVVI